MKGKWAPRLHSSWGMAHFTFLHLHWSSRIANRNSGQAFTLLSVLYFPLVQLTWASDNQLVNPCVDLHHDVTFELLHAFNQRQLIPQPNIIASFIFDIIANHSLSQKYPTYANYASTQKTKSRQAGQECLCPGVRVLTYTQTDGQRENLMPPVSL